MLRPNNTASPVPNRQTPANLSNTPQSVDSRATVVVLQFR